MFDAIIKQIRELYRTDDFIALHEPRFIGNEKKYLGECIDSTFVSSVGKFVDRFEEMTAAYTGAGKAIVCVNGTEALHMALRLVGVQYDDEVITQPLTFIATANAIAYTGAHPVFVDVDRDTMGLSPTAMSEFLQEHAEIRDDGQCYNRGTGRKISACVPMHTFGHPVKIDELVTLCEQYSIPLVEDAAESIGSTFRGKHTGTFGKIGILSYNGNKIITTGGGGMILTNDIELGKLAKHQTTQAKVPHPWEFQHDQLGYNYRMPNINAALGVAQMEQLPLFLKKKRELAAAYQMFFNRIGVESFREPANCVSNYWLNVILMKDRKERDEFLGYSNKNRVMTRPVWTLMNKLPMYRDAQTGDLTNSLWFEDCVVNIPSSIIP